MCQPPGAIALVFVLLRCRCPTDAHRLLAFLREEEERERLEEIERLRPIGTAVGPYMEYRCGACCSALTNARAACSSCAMHVVPTCSIKCSKGRTAAPVVRV